MGASYRTTSIATGADGTQVIAPAVAGKCVFVHGYSFSNAGTAGGTAQWQNTGGGALSGAMTLAQHTPATCDPSEVPTLMSGSSLGLQLVAAGGANLNGWVTWSQN